MADTDPTTPAPGADADAVLLHMGRRHAEMLERYRLMREAPPRLEDPAERLANELNELEERIAEHEAHSIQGVVVLLRAAWTSIEQTSDGAMFRPPPDDADVLDRLVWRALKAAEALAERA